MKKINIKIKYINILILIFLSIILVSCKQKEEMVVVNGEKLKKSIVDSGYYFDKTPYTEDQIIDLIDKMEVMERPKNLGTVTFSKNIEEIKLTATNPTEVKDTDIEAKIESIRDEYREVRIVTAKRNVINNDVLVMNYTGKIEGVEIEGESAIDAEVDLNDDKYPTDFIKGLIGKKTGINFTIYVNYPDDYIDPKLRGKKVAYNCIIKYIKEKVTPEFDNQFAKAHSKKGSTTSDEYRKEIAEDIKFRKEYDIKEKLRTQIYDEIYNISKVTPNEDALAWQFTKTVVEQKRLAKLKNISYEKQMTNDYYFIGNMLYTYKLQSEQTVIEPMILDELAKRYHVSFEEEDKKKWFKDMSIYQEYNSDVTYDLYKEAMGDAYIEDMARRAKILDEVISHIRVKYLDPVEES